MKTIRIALILLALAVRTEAAVINNVVTILHAFDTIGEGGEPWSPLVQYSDGTFYGTCWTGGNYCGTFFNLSVPGADAPKIAGVNKSGSSVTLTWLALVGRAYQVQFKTNLDQAAWNNSGSPVTPTNSTATAFDSVGSDRQRFYRVALLP